MQYRSYVELKNFMRSVKDDKDLFSKLAHELEIDADGEDAGDFVLFAFELVVKNFKIEHLKNELKELQGANQ